MSSLPMNTLQMKLLQMKTLQMKTLVWFRTGRGAFAVPIDSAIAVRTAAGIIDLPGSRDDVVGILPGDPPITVLSTLGAGSDHVLVLAVGAQPFGLLVDQVLGILDVDEADIGPAPQGQDADYIAGTLRNLDELILIADPGVLAGRL
jgi:chemotaxis signal transduction protein